MAALTPAGCRAGLAALLATVPSIGTIHQRRRIVRDEQSARTHLFVPAQNRINGWMISPAGSSTTVTDRNPGHHGIGVQGGGNVLTTFQWQIEGFFGVDDGAGSETTFYDLAWSVADTLNSYGLLNITGLVWQGPADIEVFGYSMFANFYLLHYCRIGVALQGRTRPA